MFHILNILLVFFNGFLQMYTTAVCLTPKKGNRRYLLPYAFCLLFIVILKCSIKDTTISSLLGPLCILPSCLFLILYNKENFWYKLFFFIICFCFVSVPGDLLLLFVFQYGLKTEISFDYYSISMTFPTILSNIIALFLCTVFLAAKKAFFVRKENRPAFLISFFLSQAVLGIISISALLAVIFAGLSILLLVFSLVSVTLTFLLFYVYLYQLEIDRKRTELYYLAQVQEKEEQSFTEFDQYLTTLSKIRHDFRNQLTAIDYLLKNEQYEEAKKMAFEMKEQLPSTFTS